MQLIASNFSTSILLHYHKSVRSQRISAHSVVNLYYVGEEIGSNPKSLFKSVVLYRPDRCLENGWKIQADKLFTPIIFLIRLLDIMLIVNV